MGDLPFVRVQHAATQQSREMIYINDLERRRVRCPILSVKLPLRFARTLSDALPGLRVARGLDAVIAIRRRPTMIVSDNGAELTSMAMLRWSQERQVDWHYIAPGKPQQNAFIESFKWPPT